MPTKCARCDSETIVTIMSKFNNDTICMDCKARERAHPKYPEADKAEVDSVKAGDYNFPGIGCPPELYVNRP